MRCLVRAAAASAVLIPLMASASGGGVRATYASFFSGGDFATFLGGSGLVDRVTGVGRLGDTVVVAGDTTSADFPVTPGAVQPVLAGGRDGFVAGLERETGALEWATYLGGPGDETVAGLAVGADGWVHVVGTTSSSDFPGSSRIGEGGAGDVFVAGVRAEGSVLGYALVAGGAQLDRGLATAYGDGVVWAVGETRSDGWTGAGEGMRPGDTDAFVLRLDPADPAGARAWRFGGSDTDRATAVQVLDGAGPDRLVVGGTTFSDDLGGEGGHRDGVAAGADAFMAFWSADGLARVVRVGGSGADTGAGVAVIGDIAYLVGTTRSADLLTTPGGTARYLRGPADAFAAAVGIHDGVNDWLALIGGPGHDGATAVVRTEPAAGPEGSGGGLAIVGVTTSGVTPSPGTALFAGAADAFVAHVDAQGSVGSLRMLGGSGFDEPLAAVALGESVAVGGATGSRDISTTPGSAMPRFPGGQEAGFIAVVSAADEPPPVDRGAVVLVHGWHGLGGVGSRCSEGPTRHPVAPTVGGVGAGPGPAEVLEASGFDVWYAHLDSTSEATPPLATNAACLGEQVTEIQRRRGSSDPVALVGHSMGGLVARAYVEDDRLYRDNVWALATLGAPHQGTPADLPLALVTFLHLGALGSCDRHPALCEITESGIAAFNRRYPARRDGVAYLAVSGDLPRHEAGWLGKALGVWIAGPDDAVVPTSSGSGLWGAESIVSNEGHSTGAAGLDIARRTYFGPVDHSWSAVPDCVAAFLVGGRCLGPRGSSAASGLPTFTVASLAEAQAEQRLPLELVTIAAGGVVTRTFYLRAGQSAEVAARWDRPGVSLVLDAVAPTDRGGTSSTPAEVGALGATTVVTASVDGLWLVALSADHDGPAQAAWFAALDGDPAVALSAVSDTASQSVTVTVAAADIQNATGVAHLTLPDGSIASGQLAVTNDGGLRAVLPAGDRPGVGIVTVTVSGTLQGAHALREVAGTVAVGSGRVRLRDAYRAYELDEDGDGRFEALLIEVGIVSETAGEGAISLDVASLADDRGGSSGLAVGAATFAAPTGPFTATVRIDGEAVAALRPGPLIVRQITLEDLTAGGAVPADHDEIGYTTAPLDTGQFGPPRHVWLPVLLRPLWR